MVTLLLQRTFFFFSLAVLFLMKVRHVAVRGAGGRHSTRGKGHEEGGPTYAKAGLSLRSPPGNFRASTPKTRVYLLSALCSHLHLWLYGGLSPTTSFGEGVNLELQLIIIPGHDRSISTYKLLWRFSSLPDRLVWPHVIAHSLPTMRLWDALNLKAWDALNLLKRGS